MNQLSRSQLQQGELLSLPTVWESLCLLHPVHFWPAEANQWLCLPLDQRKERAQGLGVDGNGAQPRGTDTILGPLRSITCLL